MASTPTPPRGMRDFLPKDKARRERLLALIRESYSAHGFDEIETPVLEDLKYLHSGLGGDNEKLSYSVMRRGLTAEDLTAAAASENPHELADLGLRFDLTVPLSRFYASHRGVLPGVFRAIQLAPAWRAERPQKGRYRQFLQCDIDILGESGPLAEIELITATLATLDALGLEGAGIRVGDRRILNAMLTTLGFGAGESDQVLITIDKLDKVGASGVVAELRERGVTGGAVTALEGFLVDYDPAAAVPCTVEAILGALPAGVDAKDAAENLALIAAAVQAGRGGQAALVFDPFLVRGMGYYTGTIFEVFHESVGYSLGGGGRYDGMIGRFLGQDVPACGFSLGFERIIELLETDAGQAGDAVALLYGKEISLETLAKLKAQLMASGKRVRLEKRSKNVRPTLERLREAGFGSFAFVDEDVQDIAALSLRGLDE